jgi:hypothetical protein
MNDEDMREKDRGKKAESFEPKSFMYMPTHKKHLVSNTPEGQQFSAVNA